MPAPRDRASRTSCERLETRRFLSASFNSNTGLLTVNGDDDPNFRDDTITLQRYFHSGQWKIKASITTGAGTLRESSFNEDAVKSVLVDVGDGDNRAEWLTGNSKRTTMRGGGGDDTLIGGTADDMLIGDSGNDSLVGDDGDDTMDASAGSDTLMGGYGADLYLGGNHIDTADYTDMGNTVYVSLDDQANDGIWLGGPLGSQEGDNVATSVERVRGTNTTYGGDYFVGSGKDNLFYGYAGNDTIVGYGGSDTAYGGSGNDLLDGGSGDDVLYGEDGNDMLMGSGGDDLLIAAGDLGLDTLIGGSGGGDAGTWDLLDSVVGDLPG